MAAVERHFRDDLRCVASSHTPEVRLGDRKWMWPAADMTKLAQWLLGLILLGGAWATLTFDLLGLDPPRACWEVVWPLPVYLLVAFGCYSLATIGYRLATFNDCEGAAHQLQEQIRQAKRELSQRGMSF